VHSVNLTHNKNIGYCVWFNASICIFVVALLASNLLWEACRGRYFWLCNSYSVRFTYKHMYSLSLLSYPCTLWLNYCWPCLDLGHTAPSDSEYPVLETWTSVLAKLFIYFW